MPAPPDNVPISPATPGGPTISTEGLPDGSEMPRTKLVTGNRNVDGGDVGPSNPLDVALSDGTQRIGNAAHPLIVAGDGTAGTPAGGVHSVQGVVGGQAMPVSGTVTAHITDVLEVVAVSLPLPAGAARDVTLTSGNALVQVIDPVGNPLGTGTHPVRTDPTGTTTQPVSGTVGISGSLPLPSGAAQDATLTSGAQKAQQVDGSGNVLGTSAHPTIVQGAGTAGTPAGGVVTIQGSASGTPLPISGSITTASVGTTGAAAPSSATEIGASDGANLQALRAASSTPAGTEFGLITRNIPSGTQPVSAASLPLPSGAAQDATLTGGTVKVQPYDGTNVIGTSTHPVRVDPTGVTTQPVSVASLPLPTGAAQDATITARLGTVGQKTMSGSAPVVIASDQPAIPISGSITASNASIGTTGAATPASATLIGGSDGTNLQPARGTTSTPAGTEFGIITRPIPSGTQTVSGAVTANVGTTGGLALDATLTAGTVKAQVYDGTNVLGTSAHPVRTDPTGATTQPVSAASLPLPTGAATDAALTGGTVKVQPFDGTNVIGTSTHPVRTDPTGVTTQPVSGTVTANVGTTAGLALDATLTGGSQKTQVVGSGGQVMPAGDAAARAVIVELTDGTNLLGATAHPVAAQIGDGTHTMPAGDAAARSVNVQVTDGTNVLGTTAHPGVVQGAAANGAAVSGNPVLAGGSDGTNARALATDSLGNLLTRPRGSTPAMTTPSIGSAPTVLIAANSSRKSVTMWNQTGVHIWVAPTSGVAVSATGGIDVAPGEVFTDSDTQSAWYAIVLTGTANPVVIENTYA